MKIKWYWTIYLIGLGISCVLCFNLGTILIFSIVALCILIIEQEFVVNDKIIIHNVYTDDFEKTKDEEK